MTLLRLDITDFRNLNKIKLEPIPQGFNFIYGNNGSGKTSILEAIYYLSLGRSFRSSVTNRIINNNAEKFSIFAQVRSHLGQNTPIGIERHMSGETNIRISGENARSIAELANLTPVQLIDSHCYNLLEAPAFRRKYLDWGAFYISNDFIRIWKQFEAALKQRNAALRGRLPRCELDIWTQALVENALQLNQIRREYVQSLVPLLFKTLEALLPVDNLEITYYPGWNEEIHYADILTNTIDKDRQVGYTQNGPHRADFKVNINSVPVKDILSRGQQKLLVCAMILTQGTLLYNNTNKKPIYLVDDLPSELDMPSRASLMGLLSKQEAQIFVTAVERETLNVSLTHSSTKMFHVEHGCLTAVI
jgi:DNA replication and repair protein RecF